MTRSSCAALGAAIALLLAVSVAPAAPVKGQWQLKLRSAASYLKGPGTFLYGTGPALRRHPALGYIGAPHNGKCNVGNLALVRKKIPVTGGKFTYRRGAYVNIGQRPLYKGKLTWKGTFKGNRRVVGTIRFRSPVTPKKTRRGYRYLKKPCDTGTLRWEGRPFTGDEG